MPSPSPQAAPTTMRSPARRERQAFGAQFEAHALGLEDRADAVGHVLILARQQARRTLHHRHGGAEPPHQLRELQSDVAAADDHQVLGHRVQFHHRHVVQRRHRVDARQLRAHRAPADVEEDARRAQAPAASLERGRADETGVADDHLGAFQAAHPGLDAVARPGDDGVLARHHARHVHAQVRDVEAELGAALRKPDSASAGHQRLRRNAADVDAGAAEVVALDHGRLQPFAAAACGDRRPGLTGADDDGVECFEAHDGSFLLPGRTSVCGRACNAARPRVTASRLASR